MMRKRFWIILLAVLFALSGFALVACSGADNTETHTVTFVGTNDAPITVNDGEYITLTEPTRDGYTFAGWFTDSTFSNRFYGDEPVKSDLTLYAYWQDGTTVEYTIRFYTTQLAAEKKVEAGGTLKYSQFPILTQRTGYVAYWSLNDEVVTSDIIGVDRNMDVYAVYESESAVKTVTFNSMGGSEVAKQIVKVNEKAKYPVEPYKDEVYFAGWFVDEACTVEFDFNTAVLNDIALYAKWSTTEPTAANGTIVNFEVPKIVGDFNGWNYSVSQKWSVVGGRMGVFFNPLCDSRIYIVYSKMYVENSGWTFYEAYNISGEKAKADLTNASRVEKNNSVDDYYIAIIRMVDRNFSLDRYCGNDYKAGYDADSGILQVRDVHRVRFETNGGSAVATQYISAGDKAAVPEDPIFLGKIFVAWTNRTGTTTINIAEQVINADTVFYAKWEDAYIVRFDSNGGTEVPSQTVAKSSDGNGSLIKEPAQPTKSGYYFGGWYTDNSFGTAFDFEKNKIKGDVTLVAKWNEIVLGVSKTVTFDYNGGSVSATQSKTVDVYSGRTIDALLYSPRKNGQYLKGWYRDKLCNVLFDFDEPIYDDITLYAGYANIPSGSYAVYYDNSPRLPETAQVGKKVRGYGISGDVVSREGYDFAGWYTDSALKNRAQDWPTANSGQITTLYANWELATTFDFTYYNEDGSVFKTEKIKINRVVNYDNLVKPDERMGYTFNGWYTDKALTQRFPDSMTVTKEINLYPMWSKAERTRVIFHDMDGAELYKDLIEQGTHDRSEYTALYDTTKSGYVFNQWFLDSERTYAFPESYKAEGADINLYGSWIEDKAAPSGSGTASSPYLVSSYDQFAAHLLKTGNNVNGKYYKFTADVQFIGGNELLADLYATVDFDGHAVKGVTKPLFERVMEGAKVKGAKLNVDIKVMNGRAANAGAVCTALYGTVEFVWVNGTINLPKISFVGGITGKFGSYDALVENCLNSANITGKDYVGGIAGTICPSSVNGAGYMRYCVNEGVMTATEGTYDDYSKKSTKHASGVVGDCVAYKVIGCVTTTKGDNPNTSSKLAFCGYNRGGSSLSPEGIVGQRFSNEGVTSRKTMPTDLLKNWLNYVKGVSKPTYYAGVSGNDIYEADNGARDFTNNDGVWYYDGTSANLDGHFRLHYFD
ncbi:MAG: InlB B-repeat-containing protein [Clostridiales bacterium]|nr:InlB B-repeat-containing protein [Clostridiales bacterium]